MKLVKMKQWEDWKQGFEWRLRLPVPESWLLVLLAASSLISIAILLLQRTDHTTYSEYTVDKPKQLSEEYQWGAPSDEAVKEVCTVTQSALLCLTALDS